MLNKRRNSKSSSVFISNSNVLIHEIRKIIVGQKDVVDQVMMSLLTGGNSIITGVPGLAKTLLIATVAQVLHLNFKRIQFTPDLMPGDITGTEIIEEDRTTGKRERVFVKGPIFANIILADEINRTPPKTQSALLEAMQERSVTVEGNTYILEKPFYVLATQNPIELEGTYPLPEAQLDRFMFNIIIEYLSEDEEIQVVNQTTTIRDSRIRKDDQRSRDHRVSETRSQDAGGRIGHALCRAAGPHEPPVRRRIRRTSSSSTSTTAPACALRSS